MLLRGYQNDEEIDWNQNQTYSPYSPTARQEQQHDGNSVPNTRQSPSSLQTTAAAATTTTPHPTVRFAPLVTVHLVPSHRAYSNRMRNALWMTHMGDTIARNSLEFAAENWDWHSVLEEHDMVRTTDGEWVHPVHLLPWSSSGGRSTLSCAESPATRTDCSQAAH